MRWIRAKGFRWAVFYFLVLCITLWVMNLHMPLYGYVRVFLAALFFLDYFIWWAYRQGISRLGSRLRTVLTCFYFLPFFLILCFDSALCLSTLDTWPAFFRTYLLGSILVLLSVHLMYGFVWSLWILSSWLTRRSMQEGRFRQAHRWANAAGLALLLLLVYAMVISTFNLRIDKVNLRAVNPSRPVPEGLRGYKILQFTDMHIGSFHSTSQIRSFVRQALVTRPDMIVFTGDMVNMSTSEMTPFLDELSHLQAPDGVYCILGNHDYGNYRQWPDKMAKYANFQKMLDYYKNLGWVCLNNASVKIERGGDTLHLLGVENWGKGNRFPKRGDVRKALSAENVLFEKPSWKNAVGADTLPGSSTSVSSQSTPSVYTVLLSHDPSHFDSVVYLRYPKVDLTLSGHTHGMQFGVRWKGKDYSPASFVYEHFSGLYLMANGQALYVNTGCGFNGIPFRLGMRPNMTLFEF